jgi:hypothetical protein
MASFLSRFAKKLGIYAYVKTPVPDPSTGDQAFQWFQTLPPAMVYTPGLIPHQQLGFITPQVLTQSTQTTAGLGGLVPGQYISQGLAVTGAQLQAGQDATADYENEL